MSKRPRTFRLLIFLSLGGLLLAGCETAPPAPVYRTLPQSTVKTVDLYFDATPSMKGFITPKRASAYTEFVKLLEMSLHSLYSPVATTYSHHRFGTVSAPFNDIEETFLPGYYDAREGFHDTDLAVVGNEMKPDGLTLVVTDLFQSDDHIENFRAALLRKGLGSSFQFGVLALSAEFDGMLYDIPPAKSSSRYHGPHPVYVLALGPQEQVRALLKDVMHRGSTEHLAVQGALLSSELGTPQVALRDLPPRDANGSYFRATELDSVKKTSGELIKATELPPFARPLRLASAASHPSVLYQTALNFDPFEVMPVNAGSAEAWKLEAFVHVCAPVVVASAAGGESDRCPIGETALLSQEPKVEIQRMPFGLLAKVSVDLGKSGDLHNPLKARKGYIYVVNLKLVPATRDYAFPAWVGAFSQDRLAAFNGAHTPNLAAFLTTMSESIAQGKQPPAALDDYLYIQSQ